MPVLLPEPMFYPDSLFSEVGEYKDNCTWKVIQTRPRQEKVIARQLHAAGHSYFLPCAKSGAPRAARVPDSYPPVFAGYLFLRTDPETRLPFQILDRTSRILDVADQATLERQLRQVWWLLGGEQEVRREEILEPGCPVVIRMGAMAGTRGVLVEKRGEFRFVVSVDFIQKGISIVVDRSSITPYTELDKQFSPLPTRVPGN